MGGLFSSPEPIQFRSVPEPQRQPSRANVYNEYAVREEFRRLNLSSSSPPRATHYTTRTVQHEECYQPFKLPAITSTPSRQISGPKRINLDLNSFNSLSNNQFPLNTPPVYTNLEQDEPEFQQINRMVTNKRRFKIDRIHKVHNCLLESAYELKKMQKSSLGSVQEKWLFHGTKLSNLDAICRNNFNWRLHGSNIGHRYGQGVSFSPNAIYASNYPSNKSNPGEKVMIVAKVLVTNACPGDVTMSLPPEGYDATMKGDGIVIVKYDDNEFFPAFVVYYHLNPAVNDNKPRGGGRRNGNFNRQLSNQDFQYAYYV